MNEIIEKVHQVHEDEQWKRKAFNEAVKIYDIPEKDYKYLFVHICTKSKTKNLVSIGGDVLHYEKITKEQLK